VCRHIAYLGPSVSLESLLLSQSHSLLHQSYQPRFQRHGTVNADGFGCGWFAPQSRPEPAVYRRDKPIWSDVTFASIAGVISSGAFLAGVRDATTGSAAEESSTSPFASPEWLFSHNGMVKDFDGPAGVALRRMVSDARIASIRGTSDSEVLFALILDRLQDGMDPGEALGWCIDRSLELSGGTFNFLLMNDRSIYATACGDSLYVLCGGELNPGAVVVASEPLDDDPAWEQVPDGSVVEAGGGEVAMRPLKEDK